VALTDSLVSYYKCDTDGSFPDSVGSNNGTISGATYTTSGKINGCYYYDGSNDSINLGNGSSFDFGSSSFSISGWVNSDIDSGARILASKMTDVNIYPGFKLFLRSDDAIDFSLGDGSTTVETNENQFINEGSFDHFVLVIDRENDLGIIYLNNVSVISVDISSVNNINNTSNMTLGAQKNSSGLIDYFKGFLDEIGFWSRALSSTEVSTLYNGGSGLQYPFGSSPTYNISNINGVATSTISKINGTAIANISKINGVNLNS